MRKQDKNLFFHINVIPELNIYNVLYIYEYNIQSPLDVLAFGPTQLIKIIEEFSPAGTFVKTGFVFVFKYELYVLRATSYKHRYLLTYYSIFNLNSNLKPHATCSFYVIVRCCYI